MKLVQTSIFWTIFFDKNTLKIHVLAENFLFILIFWYFFHKFYIRATLPQSDYVFLFCFPYHVKNYFLLICFVLDFKFRNCYITAYGTFFNVFEFSTWNYMLGSTAGEKVYSIVFFLFFCFCFFFNVFMYKFREKKSSQIMRFQFSRNILRFIK